MQYVAKRLAVSEGRGEFNGTFWRRPYEQFKVLSALFSPKMRCACHFCLERSCPEQRPRAALKPQEPHSRGPFTPGAPAPAARREVLAGRGVVVVGSWQGQAAGAISVVEKAVLTLPPPLRPLSHNANPRDGAQDILVLFCIYIM
jgi:hypothetical protein